MLSAMRTWRNADVHAPCSPLRTSKRTLATHLDRICINKGVLYSSVTARGDAEWAGVRGRAWKRWVFDDERPAAVTRPRGPMDVVAVGWGVKPRQDLAKRTLSLVS